MDMLTGMAVFAKVVEAGGFTAAAEALGLSKSAVSKHVRRLEDRLDARLLHRTTRRIALTDVGRAFYERCARVVAEAEEAELAITQLQSTPRGQLRITTGVSFGTLYAADAAAAFLQRHPDLSVELSVNDRVVDLIEEGFDLALRIGRLADSSLIARKLAPMPLLLVAAPAYFAERARPTHPDALPEHAALLYTNSPPTWSLLGPGGERVECSPNGRFRSNNGDVIERLVEAGLGITASPAFLCGPALAAGRLERVLPEWSLPETGLYAVYPHNRHLSAKVRLFVDFLAERFAHSPWSRCD